MQKNSTGSDNEFSQASPALYTRLNIQKEKARYASLSRTESNLEEKRGDMVQERGTGEQSRHGVSMLCPHGVVRFPHTDLTLFSHMQREMTTHPICRSPPIASYQHSVSTPACQALAEVLGYDSEQKHTWSLPSRCITLDTTQGKRQILIKCLSPANVTVQL